MWGQNFLNLKKYMHIAFILTNCLNKILFYYFCVEEIIRLFQEYEVQIDNFVSRTAIRLYRESSYRWYHLLMLAVRWFRWYLYGGSEFLSKGLLTCWFWGGLSERRVDIWRFCGSTDALLKQLHDAYVNEMHVSREAVWFCFGTTFKHSLGANRRID